MSRSKFNFTSAFFLAMSSAALLSCSSDVELASPSQQAEQSNIKTYELTTRHTSVFNKISYLVPAGWVVIDGESDWIAPSEAKFLGQPTFDPKVDADYAVSVIFPYLTMEDMENRRARSFEDIVDATFHSLSAAAGATGQSKPDYIKINGYAAAAINVSLGNGRSFHQRLIRLSETEIASVAGSGPQSQSASIASLVNAMSLTVQPANKRK